MVVIKDNFGNFKGKQLVPPMFYSRLIKPSCHCTDKVSSRDQSSIRLISRAQSNLIVCVVVLYIQDRYDIYTVQYIVYSKHQHHKFWRVSPGQWGSMELLGFSLVVACSWVAGCASGLAWASGGVNFGEWRHVFWRAGGGTSVRVLWWAFLEEVAWQHRSCKIYPKPNGPNCQSSDSLSTGRSPLSQT